MTRSLPTLIARLLAWPLALLAGAALAQNISDVPVAVRNNVAPNFMFMIDNSGSMINVVPSAPYSASATYTFTCTAGQTIAAGSSVDLNVSQGVPFINLNGTTYRHVSTAASGTRRCFDNNATYLARLLTTAGSSLPAEYTGHYLNWYFGAFDGPTASGWGDRKALSTAGVVQTRMEIARASATTVVNGLPLPASAGASAPVRAALATYNAGSNGAALLTPIADLTTTTRSTILSNIASLTPTGMTPLASTLADIGRYFATGYNGNISAGPVSGVRIDDFLRQSGTDTTTARNSCPSGAPSCTSATSARPIQQWCQRSYAFLMTDGRPQADRSFDLNPYLRDYDGDCTGSNASACVAGGATTSWDRKIARDYESMGSDYLDDVAKALYDIDLRPDLVAPAGRTKRNNLLTYTIGFADLQVQNDPLLTSTARQGGGLFLNAQDGPSLTKAFQTVVADALAKDAASAAVGVANPQLTVNNIAYASSYNSGTWDGDYEAFTLDPATALPVGARLWSAGDLLDTRTGANRLIASYDGSSGKPFTATNFAGTPTTLTAGVINFLRGDRTGEGTTYRTRQHLLGDIVNAEAAVVKYAGVPVIFQAANDGMLHVFDGRTDASVATRGRELWAYVPRLVHANLHLLSQTGYAHKFFVDGTPTVAEVTGTGAMNRILVGGLGKGGAGYYALDISSHVAADEAAVAAKVKWEFKPSNMGYSFGSPLVVRTSAGWRVVVSSGYDNGSNLGGDGQGHVWVLDPTNGNVVQRIDTGAGSNSNPSGLAHLATLANAAPDALTRYVWGGDLQGNVWRFDLDSFTATKIAALTDPSGNAQPVTTAPTVGPVPGASGRYFVYVGTGRYLSEDDVPATAAANGWSTQQQTMYGIVDNPAASTALPNIRGGNGASCPTGGGTANFVCQSLTRQNGPPVSFRATTNAVDTTTSRGWYVDLPLTNGRINTNSALTTKGTLIFTANVPTNTPCDPGGSSYFFALDAASGGAVARVAGGNEYYDAGVFVGYALASRPVPLDTSGGKRALIQLSDKTFANPFVPEAAGTVASWKRVYWRALR